MTRPVITSEAQYEQAIAVNAVVFLVIYVIIHWLTSDEFTKHYEKLIVVFAILRIVVGFGIILPEKDGAVRSGIRHSRWTDL